MIILTKVFLNRPISFCVPGDYNPEPDVDLFIMEHKEAPSLWNGASYKFSAFTLWGHLLLCPLLLRNRGVHIGQREWN